VVDPWPSVQGALLRAKRAVVLTGAGVSAESGVPTFRDKQTGLWEKFDVTELATPDAFVRDPALVWGWYEWRRKLVYRAEPNPAHHAIAALSEHVRKFTLVTQNVDDLHERAGSRGVLHLHGSLAKPRCAHCQRPWTHPLGIPDLPEGGVKIEPPRCTACGGRIRPGVVWFGESLPEQVWKSAVEAVDDCDAFFSVGTSSLVQPAASLVERARGAGAVTVHINPHVTGAEPLFGSVLTGPAGIVLQKVLKRM
jgi:NAD-dependent deacetylase